jgi:predicted short-subunit dehydrogenase-like oxidoreductase (DUF2520 family)
MKIAIIGAGSVGTNLHHAFELKGIKTELIHGRPLTAERLSAEGGLSATRSNSEAVFQAKPVCLPEADVYIYAIADQALREVVSVIHAPKALHLHTSGTMPIDVFGEDKPHAGILYFFQSFSRDVLIDDWSGIPCFISGRNIDDIAAIYSLAQTLTSRIYEANQHDRERLHIAGVFANNYTNLMYRIAADILKDTQIPFEALLPLIDNTAAKVHKMAPKDAQTGPAQRGDEAVMGHQIEVLSKQVPSTKEGDGFSAEEKVAVYQALGALIEKKHIHPKPKEE